MSFPEFEVSVERTIPLFQLKHQTQWLTSWLQTFSRIDKTTLVLSFCKRLENTLLPLRLRIQIPSKSTYWVKKKPVASNQSIWASNSFSLLRLFAIYFAH